MDNRKVQLDYQKFYKLSIEAGFDGSIAPVGTIEKCLIDIDDQPKKTPILRSIQRSEAIFSEGSSHGGLIKTKADDARSNWSNWYNRI